MKYGFILLLFCISTFSNAGELPQFRSTSELPKKKNYSSFLVGHNLTSTSYTPEQGQLVFGPYDIVYGITDQLMVGTSPWMIVGYNMPMVDFKYSFTPPALFDHASVEMMYFKTFEYGFNAYHQESTWTRLTGTFDVSSFYKIHGCFGAQYFFDDLAPFSMRPPPTNHTPITLSISALQEIHFTKHFGSFLESGFLGFNYPNRYLHLGASGFFQWSGGYIQLGMSKTFPIGPEYLKNLYSYDDWADRTWRTNKDGYFTSIYYWYNEPVHPEVQIEFLL